ncbi:hypothetical protein TrVE_jg2301 [Triparma verrucosa]|uniref:NAD(+) diphosphatase n=1 Tax=Triparma verrucosa TaxID=1606542 RepID=A0A9W7FK97_9STRA|nr:hypothetical protein TrVE_jg2301 [Triparma verrucosa]
MRSRLTLLLTLLALATRSSALSTPFFDTSGRLQRTTSPPAPQPGAETFYVPVYNGEVLMDDDGAMLLGEAAVAPYMAQDDCVVSWLGSATEGALAAKGSAQAKYWLLELSHLEERPDALGEWAPLREAGGGGTAAAVLSGAGGNRCADDVAALLNTARGLALWHRSVKFCSACGGKTEAVRHGRNRQCKDCGARYRPRVDPSVIVLVVNEKRDRCLLGRPKSWAAGRWSTLAGFVEFGETLEECVVREITEEAGVTPTRDVVGSLTQVASQPWLFPRSLMVGYEAVVDDAALLKRQEDELQGLAWFDKDYVRQQVEAQGDEDAPATPGDFHVPSRVSLARTLIDMWLNDDR